MSRYTGRKRKYSKAFRKGYDRTGGFYGNNYKRRKYAAKYTKPEKKFFDIAGTIGSIITTGSFLVTASVGPFVSSGTITDIPQGTGESNRIGRKCTITKLRARMNFEFITSETATLGEASLAHETVRFMIYWDKQCNGTVAAAASILEADTYNSFRNLANKGRFVILYDQIFAWNTAAIGSGNGTDSKSALVVGDYQIRINKKLYIPIEYSGTTGTLSEIRSNNIGMMVWAKHGARMKMTASRIRLRFNDF